jgi:hypothetical protein
MEISLLGVPAPFYLKISKTHWKTWESSRNKIKTKALTVQYEAARQLISRINEFAMSSLSKQRTLSAYRYLFFLKSQQRGF